MTKLTAPAAERNKEPILAVLQEYLPKTGTVLEVASGTGQHAAYFAPRLAPLKWLPSEADKAQLASIKAWRADLACESLLAPIELDVLTTPVPLESIPVSAIVNINMLHIAPWACCSALFARAATLLPSEGTVVLYGPFRRGGQHTAPTNAQFDAQLRARDPAWGVRDFEAVSETAEQHNFGCTAVIDMPANNLSLVFSKR